MPDPRCPVPEGCREHHATLASGLRMRWLEAGPEEGPVAMLLHGFPDLAWTWRAQLRGCAGPWRVVAPDLRGYGGTDAPREVSAYRPATLARDVLELADLLGVDRFHLAGHDWGGGVAWTVAERHPERLASLVALNCPHPAVLLRAALDPAQLLRSWYILFFQLPWLPEAALAVRPAVRVRRAFHATCHPANLGLFDAAALAPIVAQAEAGFTGGLNYYRAALREPPLRPKPTPVPARMVWGVADPILGVPLTERSRYDGLASGELDVVLVPGAGHWVHLEAPGLVTSSLRGWWEGHA